MIITPQTPQQAIKDSGQAMFVSPKDRLDFYRREIYNETGNLASRTNAYLSSQSFLVIAYASSMAITNPEWGPLFTLVVPATMALFGILSGVSAWPGIKAACDIIEHWYLKQSGLLNSHPTIGRAYDDSPLFSDWESSDSGQRKSLTFSKRTPWLFSTFWAFLGIFALWIQLADIG
ncbi:MAG TPA: hypothetical protein ENI17_08670 [Pseudomonas xinjiangensis]|uniref:Uncharacterized protein n=2 Tax=root TaxID=1 RepID=A0A7V1BLN2_9GAMM|nr:hypothetical protein [Halopseudomonas xinjiangensis]HEC47686.1 hypothetical protein [Halopseudomonas xinjiangensis]